MASLQAHLAVWVTKWRVKRRLKGVRDFRVARKILHPDPYKVPPIVQVSPAHLGGVAGERLGGPSPGNIVLLYLHGGGLFARFGERQRPPPSFLSLPRVPRFSPAHPPAAPRALFPSLVARLPSRPILLACRGFLSTLARMKCSAMTPHASLNAPAPPASLSS